MKNRVSRVGLSFSLLVIIALALGSVPSSLAPAQGTQVKRAPPFDFSDAFYLQNGNNPAKPAPPPPSTGSSFARAYNVRLPEVIFQLIFSPFGRPVDEVGSVNRPLVLFFRWKADWRTARWMAPSLESTHMVFGIDARTRICMSDSSRGRRML